MRIFFIKREEGRRRKICSFSPKIYVNKNGPDSLQKRNALDFTDIKYKQPNVPSSSLMQLPD